MASRRAVTPARVTSPRMTRAKSRTPGRPAAPTESLSPPPSLPPGKAVVVTSPQIPFDPVMIWSSSEQSSDPCFSSEEQSKKIASEIKYPIQPWFHCNPLYFPPVARLYGLVRWTPQAVFSIKNRGPGCVREGKLLKCHKSCLPAFLYTLPDGKECNNARGRGLPTLVFQWRIDKENGLLNPNACWFCFSHGNSFCGIAGRVVDGKPFGLLPMIPGSMPTLAEAAIEAPSLMATSLERPIGSSIASPIEEEDPFSVSNAPPGAPKKLNARTALEAELDDASTKRAFKLTGISVTGDQRDFVGRPSQPASALLFGKRVVSEPTQQAGKSGELTVSTSMAGSGPRNWRDIVHDVQQRRAVSVPASISEAGTTAGPVQPAPKPALLAPFEPLKKSATVLDSADPQTPSPLPRVGAGQTSTPRAHIDTQPLASGIHRARLEINRMVAALRTSVEIAEEAEKASNKILDESMAASDKLKESVEKEYGLIEDVRSDRDRLAARLNVLEGWRYDIEGRLQAKTAEAKELKDKLTFSQTAVETSRRQAAAVDDMWKESLSKLNSSEEARGVLQGEVDSLRQTIRALEEGNQDLLSRHAGIETALIAASEENALLEARVSSFERYFRENGDMDSQPHSLEDEPEKQNLATHPVVDPAATSSALLPAHSELSGEGFEETVPPNPSAANAAHSTTMTMPDTRSQEESSAAGQPLAHRDVDV